MIRNTTIKLALFYLISISFILLNIWFVVKKDTLIVNTLPFFLAILLLVIFSFDKIVYLIVFFSPLSVPLHEIIPGFVFDMYLPTEPLLFGLLILFFLKVIHEKGFDKEILLHPVSLAIYLNLLWIFLTCLTSTMPVVSFKFLLSRIWFVVGLYFFSAKIFVGGKNMERYVWLYVIPLLAVIVYSTYRHLGYGLWDKRAAHFVVSPFYNDHTSYGAVLAFYLPFVAMFSFSSFLTKKVKLISLAVLGVLFLAFVLSYSRAAWLSLIVAIGVFGIIKLRIRFKPLFLTFVTFVTLFLLFQTQIFMQLEQNSEQSSANLSTHISSISNISTDASNLERINRWSCAIRMFANKPVFGYGPGTYMFKYAPYQLKRDRTIISTNSADGGNAHSEYLGPLSESGVLGFLTFLIILGTVIYTAVNTYTRLTDVRLKAIVLAALIGLITYYFHGLLNNFLDTDKLSVPFWGFTAMIVAIDIYSRKEIYTQKNPA
ncbi:MAG: O-antigen ligase family protein [Prolixibacteraceae bacterium]|nr:O-antigen ligase family protein [Prolixibacteraceae bacterium]MBT6764988.1 O-antigen ligase family protein [Prolixibacteraceae bacterium]MBT6999216.1 O-antigen ligase family protein [Prolixibacteraceae bacterium]MBT7393301.1 O-antigen ligase family protein [Prolixibacteraceae bacterium]